jgi:UDP:flavonoid glycosyltransferase YjiC (YdhE family)
VRVRALLTTVPGYGHFMPLVSLGRALASEGHTVGVATAESLRPLVDREGFEFVSVGAFPLAADAPDPEQDDPTALRNEFRAIFVEWWATSFLSDADTAIGWRPDVLVREEGEFGAPVLAAELDIPCVDVGWGPLRPPELVDEVGAAMEPLWQERGLQPDPLNGTYHWLYVDPCPPSLQSPHALAIATRHLMRPVTSRPSPNELPDWLVALERPAVYVTLGTVPKFADDGPFFLAAIEALKDADVEVIVTVGPRGDPDAYASESPRVHVERFIPQAAVLPHCIAAITNGGSGATMGALAHGVPVLAVSDRRSPSQVRNGEALAACGAGRHLARGELTPDGLGREIHALLSDGRHRDAAAKVAAEIVAMPDPSDVAAAVEHIVATGSPWRSDDQPPLA